MTDIGKEIKGKLGFGLMRLPKLEDGKTIDVEQVKVMVDKFLAAGLTYFDTAYAYPGSEEAIRKALVERYPRESFQLATKNAAWAGCKTREEAIAQFTTSLERTGAGYFDYYLLHNLGQRRTKAFYDFDMFSFVQEMKAKGLIRHIGFSMHAGPDELEPVLKEHPELEFVQLQINYADWNSMDMRSKDVYEMARKYDKPIIIMEPVKGGLLADPPGKVSDILKAADPEASCASWAIRFAASLPGIMVVLSGMSNVEQMEDNLSYMTDFKPLTDEERKVVDEAREELEKIPLIPCTKCNYCAKVCPMDIGVSGTFMAMNYHTIYQDLELAKGRVDWNVKAQGHKMATECIKCGACEEACPQHLNIRELLEEAVDLFEMEK